MMGQLVNETLSQELPPRDLGIQLVIMRQPEGFMCLASWFGGEATNSRQLASSKKGTGIHEPWHSFTFDDILWANFNRPCAGPLSDVNDHGHTLVRPFAFHPVLEAVVLPSAKQTINERG